MEGDKRFKTQKTDKLRMKLLIDAPCESNLNTVVEEHVSSENTCFDITLFCCG